MVITTSGHIKYGLHYLVHPEIPIFLLDRPEPVLFDAGLSCAGQVYVEAVKAVLGDRSPSILFLTHSHWDHCGAAPVLKAAFPDMKIAASALTAEIVKRPNALTLIRQLNEAARAEVCKVPGIEPYLINDPFIPFAIDIELSDGQVFDLGAGTTVQVLATPGHTQDHHSFYLPKEKILIAGEAAGVYYGPSTISPEFVSDYEAYLSSLRRLALLPAEVYCQGHMACLTGEEDISDYMQRSIQATVHFKNRAEELLEEENGSVERVVQRIKAEQYDNNPELKQPATTYMLNLQARIAHLAAKSQQ